MDFKYVIFKRPQDPSSDVLTFESKFDMESDLFELEDLNADNDSQLEFEIISQTEVEIEFGENNTNSNSNSDEDEDDDNEDDATLDSSPETKIDQKSFFRRFSSTLVPRWFKRRKDSDEKSIEITETENAEDEHFLSEYKEQMAQLDEYFLTLQDISRRQKKLLDAILKEMHALKMSKAAIQKGLAIKWKHTHFPKEKSNPFIAAKAKANVGGNVESQSKIESGLNEREINQADADDSFCKANNTDAQSFCKIMELQNSAKMYRYIRYY